MLPPHVTAVTVRWNDLDSLGHVNNSVYFTYIEQARLHWFHETLNYTLDTTQQGPVVASAQCDFKRAIHYPDTVLIDTHVTTVRTRSFTLHHTLRSNHTQKIHAEADIVLVWVDYPQNKAIHLPNDLLQQLKP